MGSGKGAGGGRLTQSVGGDSHNIFTYRLWQNRFHYWCRVSEGAKHSLTVPVLS